MTKNKVKTIVLLDQQTLESTENATQAVSDRVLANTYFSDKLNLVCRYTTGSGETATNCYIKVWGYTGSRAESKDFPYSGANNEAIVNDDNWVQIGEYAVSSGEATFTPTVFKIAGGAGDTTYEAHFPIDITFSHIRVSAYEDGVTTNKGNLTVIALIQ